MFAPRRSVHHETSEGALSKARRQETASGQRHAKSLTAEFSPNTNYTKLPLTP
jgi:hypothetical protein